MQSEDFVEFFLNVLFLVYFLSNQTGLVLLRKVVCILKVQAVLLLLGGCEVSAGAQGVGMPSQNHRVITRFFFFF